MLLLRAHTVYLVYRRGTISATGVVDRLLGRLSAYLRGEFIEDINDHSTSEYVRLFEQIVLNSRVPLLEKAASVVVDALSGVAEKVSAVTGGDRFIFWRQFSVSDVFRRADQCTVE